VKAVKDGSDNMLMESSACVATNDLGGHQDASGNTEECSATAVDNCNSTTLSQCGGDDHSDLCKNGYCVACLSGSYPIALDW